jgi:hypothetical protein
VAARITPVEHRVLPVLKAKPFEVSVTARSASPEAAWLAWYLRELGREVDFDPESEPTESTVWTSEDLPQESRAIADLIEPAFGLRRRTQREFGVTFRRPVLIVSIFPMGTNNEEKRRKSVDHTPKRLRWIP